MDGTMGGTTIFADKAFMDLAWQKTCFDTYRIRIKTPIKSNMKENPERAPFILSKAKIATRRLVETVYAQLTERLHIARIKVRDAWHLLNIWHTKILTHTICVFLNACAELDSVSSIIETRLILRASYNFEVTHRVII